MVCDTFIEIEGWLCGTILPRQVNGKRYLTFIVQTPNGSRKTDGVLSFECFLWEGELYDYILGLGLVHADNIGVRGTFTTNTYTTNGNEKVRLRIMVEHLQCIAIKRAATKQEINLDIPVQKDVSRLKDNDNKVEDFDWGDI